MQIGQFITEMKTTKETVRYYIDEQLLTPEKVNGKYEFTKIEQNEFENIRELRDMGLPIRVIKQIKMNKDFCGTKRQWESNLTIIDIELSRVELELEQLNNEKLALNAVRDALKSRLK